MVTWYGLFRSEKKVEENCKCIIAILCIIYNVLWYLTKSFVHILSILLHYNILINKEEI